MKEFLAKAPIWKFAQIFKMENQNLATEDKERYYSMVNKFEGNIYQSAIYLLSKAACVKLGWYV